MAKTDFSSSSHLAGSFLTGRSQWSIRNLFFVCGPEFILCILMCLSC